MLSVYLPLLPLEALRPCWSEPVAVAIIEQGAVLTLSADAARAGVRPGMRTAGINAIAPDTLMLERAPDQEEQALAAIAMALMQYTPELTLEQGAGILLDVTASLTLFKGPHALCLRIAQTMRALGFTARIGAAPTASGAWLLARSRRQAGLPRRRRTLSIPSMVRCLNALPCSLLPEAAPHRDWLTDIGASRLGVLRQLPRPGLIRRSSKALLAAVDQAYGEAPEMFVWLKPPLTFSARIETFDRIEHADALLDGATRLLLQLIGWLSSLQKAIRTLTFHLEHERGRAAIPPTELELALAEPAWNESHLIRLLKERLGKLQLAAPVIALRLEAVKIEAMAPLNESLFPEPGGTPQEYHRLLELLTARLGAGNVLTPADMADYRPEVCNYWMPAMEKPLKPQPGMVFNGRPFFLLPKAIPLLMRDERPFYGSPLKVIQGPERIEAGWWNEQTAVRDYYIAQGSDASCYWIYLERTQPPRWHLHGLYA